MNLQTKPESSTPAETPAAGSATIPAEPADEGIPIIDPKSVPREPEGIIDVDVLEQIREMDDMDEDEDEEEEEGPRAFSRGIVFGYFDQAEQTFGQMQAAL